MSLGSAQGSFFFLEDPAADWARLEHPHEVFEGPASEVASLYATHRFPTLTELTPTGYSSIIKAPVVVWLLFPAGPRDRLLGALDAWRPWIRRELS